MSSGTPGRELAGWIQIAVVVAVVLAAGLVTLRLSTGGEPPPAVGDNGAESGVPVEVVRPETGTHAVRLALTGTVQAKAEVLLAPEVAGRIVEVSEAVRAGGRFEADEVLFRIDPRDYQIAYTRAEAALADARSALAELEAEAEIAVAEFQRVYPDREVTPLAAREPQLEAARARVQSARADLNRAAIDLERTRYALPFAGRIIDSRIENGQLVSPGQSYGSAYAFDGLEIVAPAAPEEIARLDGAIGRRAEAALEGADAIIEARVVREAAAVESRSRLSRLFLQTDDAAELRPGLFADVEIIGPELSPVMRVPAEAVIGLGAVYRVRDGVIERAEVRVLDRLTDTLIIEPVEVGEGLIASPLPDGAVGREARIVEVRGAGAD